MPPSVEDRLRDVLEAIIEIEKMLAGVGLDDFSNDRMRRLATERCLGILCEAAHKLPDEVKRGAPTIDWRKMNDFANLLRHAYHVVKADVVWDIIQNHLPPLKSFVEFQIRAGK